LRGIAPHFRFASGAAGGSHGSARWGRVVRRRAEARGGEGRGSESREERVRVSSAFILWECDWSHWIRDERSKIVGLFGLKWA